MAGGVACGNRGPKVVCSGWACVTGRWGMVAVPDPEIGPMLSARVLALCPTLYPAKAPVTALPRAVFRRQIAVFGGGVRGWPWKRLAPPDA